MSAPRTPTKSGDSRTSESKNPRGSISQSGTPPIGSGKRRSIAGSQLGSPVVRSGATSAVSPSGTRDKLSSASNKLNAASPVPGTYIHFEIKRTNNIGFYYFVYKLLDQLRTEQISPKMFNVRKIFYWKK